MHVNMFAPTRIHIHPTQSGTPFFVTRATNYCPIYEYWHSTFKMSSLHGDPCRASSECRR